MLTPAPAYNDVFSWKARSPPEVTVCISLYNYARYIEECLNSVHGQTLASVGLVIVDDDSTDESIQVTKSWLLHHTDRFDSIRLVQHSENAGAALAKNTALALAESKLVFLLDADNLIMPICLERLIEILSCCDADFAYSILARFGNETGLFNCQIWYPPLFLQCNYIDSMCLLRKDAWQRLNGFRKLACPFEDYDFWCRLALVGGYGLLCPEILGKYRVHSASLSKSNGEQERCREMIRFVNTTYRELSRYDKPAALPSEEGVPQSCDQFHTSNASDLPPVLRSQEGS